MSGQGTSTTLHQLRISPTRRRNRRLLALAVAVGLLGPALAVSPALASGREMFVMAAPDSTDFFRLSEGGWIPLESQVTYEVFDATGDGTTPVATSTGGMAESVRLLLPDVAVGVYKISASADGYLPSWYRTSDDVAGLSLVDLFGYDQHHDFESADAITVDRDAPENSTWQDVAFTLLHEFETSVSGAVYSDPDDPFDSLLPNVPVHLLPMAGDDPVYSTQTDANGYYVFANPMPGSYLVRFDRTVDGETTSQWWPETPNRAEAQVIEITDGVNYTPAYAVFLATPTPVSPGRILALSGDPVPGATLTATPENADDTNGVADPCTQRFSWFIDDAPVPGAFGNTFVVPAAAVGTSISARLDIVSVFCAYDAMLSNPIGPIDAGLTLLGAATVTPVDQNGDTDVALAFGHVGMSGITTVETSTDGPAPTGFSVLTAQPVYYFIETTAEFDEALGVQVCVSFDTLGMSEVAASNQSLFHFVDDAWEDITDPETRSPGRVCGTTTSFSPFIVGQAHWPFRGFLQPVDSAPTVNAMKAGAAVPIKFGLGGFHGLAVIETGSPVSEAVSCAGASTLDTVEQTVAAGGSSLGFDAASDTYSYVWKTQKGWAGTCRQFVLTLTDGSVHSALFSFTK